MIDRAGALLAWMSHLGQGSTGQFIRSADSLTWDQPDQEQQLFRRLAWRRLLELGHVCKQENKSWHVEPPTLSLLPSGAAAVWRGGRVQTWVREMQESADALACVVVTAPVFGGPPHLRVSGELSAFQGLAAMIGASFEDRAALRILAAMPSFATWRRDTAPALRPTAGAVECFDYENRAWIATGLRSAACRYSHSKLGFQYFVEVETGRFLSVAEEATAIHFGASVEGRMLRHYDDATQKLSVDWRLPIEFSRPLCLCSGLPPENDGIGRIYLDVPPGVSLLLNRALDGEQNRVRWF